MSTPTIGAFASALVVRVEPGFVTANLYERMGGRLRFFGRGVALGLAAQDDHGEALIQALGSLEAATGRRLLRNGMPVLPQTTDGRGVDTMASVVRTANRPLRWSLASTGQRPSAALLARVSMLAGSVPVGVVGLAGDEMKRPLTAAARVAELFAQPLDALLLVQDPSVRFDEAQQHAVGMIGSTLTVAAEADADANPACLMGADPEMAARWTMLLGERARRIDVGPIIEREGSFSLRRVGEALAPVFAQAQPAHLGGFERLRGWLETPPMPAREATLRSALAVSRLAGAPTVRLLDCGLPPDLAETNGGTASGLSAYLGAPLIVAAEDAGPAVAEALARAATPWSIATAPNEVWAEAARLRILLGELAPTPGPLGALAVTGPAGLVERGPAWAALVGLTAGGAPGVFSLWNDAAGTLHDAAALAVQNAAAADEVLAGAITRLGTAVVASPGGALRIDIHHSDGYRLTVEVPEGELEVFPLEANMPARIQIRPGQRQDVGAGAGRPVDMTVQGGEIGLIFDNRGGTVGAVGEDVAARWLRGLRGLAPRLSRTAVTARAG